MRAKIQIEGFICKIYTKCPHTRASCKIHNPHNIVAMYICIAPIIEHIEIKKDDTKGRFDTLSKDHSCSGNGWSRAECAAGSLRGGSDFKTLCNH